MADHPDYAAINPPDDKPESEYNWRERRAELYRLLKQRGHPRNLEVSQYELGRRYGVDQSQISKDFKQLRDYYRARSGDRTVAETKMLGETVIERIVEQARELESTAEDLEAAGDFRAAAKMRERAAGLWSDAQDKQMQFNDFLFDTGELEQEPDKIDVDVSPQEAYMEALRQVDRSGETD
jgi:hypothetical protein